MARPLPLPNGGHARVELGSGKNELLSSRGAWEEIPDQADVWPSRLRVEFHDDGRTRLVVCEGPHPPGTADLGRQAWEMLLPKLESLLGG